MIQHLKWLTLFSVSYFSNFLRFSTYILPYVILIRKQALQFSRASNQNNSEGFKFCFGRSSRPASRYSWRTRSSSPSKKEILGHFICPLCHNPASIFHGGGRDVVKASFPINQLATYTIDASTVPSVEGSSTK
jgi:hypothetical protein